LLVIRRDARTVDNIWSASIDGRETKQITNFTSERIFAFDVALDGQLAMRDALSRVEPAITFHVSSMPMRGGQQLERDRTIAYLMSV
jgi:hypothetical protein